jgi:hypothetical protein
MEQDATGADARFAAQVRFSSREPWVTVTHTPTRREAAREAARAFIKVTDANGRTPWQVRIAEIQAAQAA